MGQLKEPVALRPQALGLRLTGLTRVIAAKLCQQMSQTGLAAGSSVAMDDTLAGSPVQEAHGGAQVQLSLLYIACVACLAHSPDGAARCGSDVQIANRALRGATHVLD
jgi:hypothetical protein